MSFIGRGCVFYKMRVGVYILFLCGVTVSPLARTPLLGFELAEQSCNKSLNTSIQRNIARQSRGIYSYLQHLCNTMELTSDTSQYPRSRYVAPSRARSRSLRSRGLHSIMIRLGCSLRFFSSSTVATQPSTSASKLGHS